MIKAENLLYLKRTLPNEDLEVFYEFDKSTEKNVFEVAESKNGLPILRMKSEEGGKNLNSSMDPVREGKKIIDSFENISQYNHVVFFGIGMGYQIDYFTENYPDKHFSIYEPNVEILYHYLSNKILPVNRLDFIGYGDNDKGMIEFISSVFSKTKDNLLIIDLPVYKTIFSNEYNRFFSLFRQIIGENRTSIHVNYGFQKKWVLNGLINFPEVLKSNNFLMQKSSIFKGKPAIIAASGPSITDEKETLRYVKDNGLAYIFSIGSAIDFFIENGFNPDFSTVYDPTNLIVLDFKKVIDNDIKDIPLIFGSSCGYELVKKYPGPKYHMVINQDTSSIYYLHAEENNTVEGIMDAPTIAVITLQLLYKLGFNPIILAGQNLALRGGMIYADEITEYSEMKRTKKVEINSNYIKVEDVYGNETYTTASFNRMRQNMENIIRQMKDVEIINTTRGGAKIEGTAFMHLDDVIKERLASQVTGDKLDAESFYGYDMGYVKKQYENMKASYNQFKSEVNNFYDILGKIKKLALSQNFQQVEKQYKNLEAQLDRFMANPFFKVYLLPMNRVYFDFLMMEINNNIKKEKNQLKKADLVLQSFSKFISICSIDKQKLDNIFKDVSGTIENLLEKQEV